jgi:excinuclease ABC subunit A
LGQPDRTTSPYVEDIKKLLAMLQKLANSGNTVVVEHNLNVIQSADWIIDLDRKAAQQADRLSQKEDRNK